MSHIGRSNRRQQLQKFLAGACGKGIGRVGHNVGVHALGKVEAHRAATRVSIGIIVGDDRTPVEFEKRTVTGVEDLLKCGAG